MPSNHVKPFQVEARSELEAKKQELEASVLAHSEVRYWYTTCKSTGGRQGSGLTIISLGAAGQCSGPDCIAGEEKARVARKGARHSSASISC